MRLFIFVFWSFAAIAKPLHVEVTASSLMLMNADTGAILYEKNGHISAYPASTTKIATALFILDEKKPPWDRMLTVSEESLKMKPLNKKGDYPLHWWDADGTRMWLKAGEILSVEMLLHGLMLISGNDAANVLAEGIGGSTVTFQEELNRYLKQIGCLNTHFVNAHGCHHPEHVSTAYDLCLITQKALHFPQFREIVAKTSYMKPKTNKQGPVELKQFNQLIKPGKFQYAKAIGVKTGFHSAAQNTLVAAAEENGRTLIAVVLGTTNSGDRYLDAIRLFEAAFAETKETRRFFGKEHLFTRQVTGAKTVLKAALAEDLNLSYYPAEEPICRAFIHWGSPSLPIRKNEIVGEVRIVNEKGALLGRADLCAKEEVKGTVFFVLQDFMTHLFR